MKDDLVHYEYHGSTTHPHMSISNRAAQFTPFAALVGYDEMIDESNRFTEENPLIGNDKADDLDHILIQLNQIIDQHPYVLFNLFIEDTSKSGGHYQKIEGKIKKIDHHHRLIVLMDDQTIMIDTIVDMVCPLLNQLNETTL